MKALVVPEYMPFSGVTEGDLPDPVPGPGEVVLTVAASELGFPDILQIEGRYQVKAPLPFAPGMAAAGVVSAIGSGVTGVTLGQRMLALVDHGAHAAMLKAPAAWCFPVPDEVEAETAAALGLVYQTAWFALQDRAHLQRGETVLVLGASGGIGMAAVQLAKAMGAGKVIAASRGAEGAERALSIGAEAVVDSSDLANLRNAVQAHTNGQGVDVIIDPVGGPLAEAALRAMAWSGRLVVVGFASGEIPQFKANYLLVKNISISGIQWTDYRARQIERVADAQRQIFALWQAGKLSPLISARLPLARAAEGLSALNQGTAGGKILLLP